LHSKNATLPDHSYNGDDDGSDSCKTKDREQGIDHGALRKRLMESASSSSSSSPSSSSESSEDASSDRGHVENELDGQIGVDAAESEDQQSNENEILRRYWEEAFSFLRDKLGVPSLQVEENQDRDSSDGKVNVAPPRESNDFDSSVDSVDASNVDDTNVESSGGERATLPMNDRTVSKRNQSVEISRLYSPEQVVSEILAAIRTICRLQQLLAGFPEQQRRCAPFRHVTLLPVIDEVNNVNGDDRVATGETMQSPASCLSHPAIHAKRQLLRAVLILASFRPAPSGHRKAHDHQLPLGEIIQNWLVSLQGEISESWACHDRAQQRTTAGLVFDSAFDLDTDYDPRTKQYAAMTSSLGASALESNGGASNQLESFLATALPSQNSFTGGPKTQTRLSKLLQRYLLAQMVVGVLLMQGNCLDAYALVIDYIRSNASTIRVGPRLAPTLSFVVLRGLLHPGVDGTNASQSWLQQHLVSRDDGVCRSLLMKSLSLVLRHTSSLWSARLKSIDDRIVDLSLVELASWREIVRADGSWLNIADCEDSNDIEAITALADSTFRRLSSDTLFGLDEAMLSDAHQLTLIVSGDKNAAKSDLIDSLQRGDMLGRARSLAASLALRQLVLRNVDALKEAVGHTTGDDFETHPSNMLDLKGSFENASLSTLVAALQCAQLLADGTTACDALESLLKYSGNVERSQLDPHAIENLFDCVHALCDTPMVRVINLQRRSDRLHAFHAQALRENLLMVLAIPECPFESDDSSPQSGLSSHGCHAIDGGGRKAEAHESLSRRIGSPSRLPSLVNVHWRPSDLKAFDENAPSDEGLATMSGSEIACALSHIASWRGALRSYLHPSNSESCSDIFRHPQTLRRLFRLGGFAKGDALLSANSSMEPSPVCLILEDDAVLVERFRERLEEVLLELPRDFHFFSLGYGRPKSAPILPYGKHVGIPSHLFYLTGYLVSEVGCRYLLDSMPVTGPIDAWIGLKMTQNWDNSFGVALGVGSHQLRRKADAAPTRKQLSQILHFRAYCALTPLCSQRVENASGTGTERRTWRLRDTDVAYSGDSARRSLRGE
jgi:hypothetical protein